MYTNDTGKSNLHADGARHANRGHPSCPAGPAEFYAPHALLFSWYVAGLANFKSAAGALIVFLVLAAYLYTASIIFLVGIQIDELLRKDASPTERGIIDLIRHGAGATR